MNSGLRLYYRWEYAIPDCFNSAERKVRHLHFFYHLLNQMDTFKWQYFHHSTGSQHKILLNYSKIINTFVILYPNYLTRCRTDQPTKHFDCFSLQRIYVLSGTDFRHLFSYFNEDISFDLCKPIRNELIAFIIWLIFTLLILNLFIRLVPIISCHLRNPIIKLWIQKLVCDLNFFLETKIFCRCFWLKSSKMANFMR